MSDPVKKKFRTVAEIKDGLKLTTWQIGVAAYNPLTPYNSPSRINMFHKQLGQAVTLKESDLKIINGGTEIELAKYTAKSMVDNRSRVVNVIPRYREYDGIDSIKTVEYCVLFEDLDTGELDYAMVKTHSDLHQQFGFRYDIKDTFYNLGENDIIEAGTVFADTPAVIDGMYSNGRLANVCFCSDAIVAEDAVRVSESYAKKNGFNTYETVVVEYGATRYPNNIYGTPEFPKYFPEIGEYVHTDGILMSLREYDSELAISMNSKVINNEYDNLFDKNFYVKNIGKVVDIKILGNRNKKSEFIEDAQTKKYMEAYIKYNSDLVEAYETECDRYYAKTGIKIPVSHALTALITDALIYSNNRGRDHIPHVKKINKKVPIDAVRIEFTIEYDLAPGIGYKCTDLAGSKSIIVDVVPDKSMPHDKNGRYADVLAFHKSSVARMNPGRNYEQYFNDVSYNLKMMVMKKITEFTGKPAETSYHLLNKEDANEVFNLIKGLYLLFNNDLSEGYASVTDYHLMMDTIKTIITINAAFLIRIEDEQKADETVMKIEASIYAPLFDKIYIHGKETNSKMRIAPMYLILLSKISDLWLSCASAELNHYLVPVAMNKAANKHNSSYRNNPTKTLGETEVRLEGCYGGPDTLAVKKDRATSPTTHKSNCKDILSAPFPSNIDLLKPEKPSSDKILELINSIFNCCGIQIVEN